jgi:hypothetical protein
MVVSLPVTGYVPGQDIPVTIEIDNASNVLVTNVKCRLKKVSGGLVCQRLIIISSVESG